MTSGAVLQVCPSVPPRISGSGRYAFELASRIASAGRDSILVTFGDDGDRKTESQCTVIYARSFRIEELDLPIPGLDFIRRVSRLLREPGAAAIVTHTRFYPSTIASILLARALTRTAIVHIEHGSGHRVAHANPVVSRIAEVVDHTLARCALKLVDGCIAVGPLAKDFLRHIGYGGQIRIIPNSATVLPPQELLTEDRDDGIPVLLFAGRITKSKGIDTLLEACGLLKDLEFTLLIAGEGTDLDYARDLSSKIPARKIVFLGRRDDVGTLIRDSDIVIVPSRYDSLPSTILESAAMGRRVIASDAGDARYVLGNDYEYLFPAGDSLALSVKIRAAIEKRDFIDLRIRRRIEEEFDWNKNAIIFLNYVNEFGRSRCRMLQS